MAMQFRAIPGGYGVLALHPDPIGVIEFLPGAVWGLTPTHAYEALLRTLYDARYTIIAVPLDLSLDHAAFARKLLLERPAIDRALGTQAALPRFWVGHSLGCKFIILLEAWGRIMDEPSLWIAPVIAGTRAALPPIPGAAAWLAGIMDELGLGVRPTVRQTRRLVAERADRSFKLVAILSLADDDIARDTVTWLIATLGPGRATTLLTAQAPGGHDEPVGFQLGDDVVHLDPTGGKLVEHDPTPLASLAISLLARLRERRAPPPTPA